jgi:hypothetical protein
MAHSDRLDSLVADRGGLRPLQGPGDASFQLDMFGAPTPLGCGSGLEGMRAELREILGVPAAASKPEEEATQLRLAFLRAELARLDAA